MNGERCYCGDTECRRCYPCYDDRVDWDDRISRAREAGIGKRRWRCPLCNFEMFHSETAPVAASECGWCGSVVPPREA